MAATAADRAVMSDGCYKRRSLSTSTNSVQLPTSEGYVRVRYLMRSQRMLTCQHTGRLQHPFNLDVIL